MDRGKINVLIDGQWGSTGKGKLAGLLAHKHKPELALCNFMPNAGHTYVDDSGFAVMTQQLPTSLVNPSTELHLVATSAIDNNVFLNEMAKYNERFNIHGRLTVDPMAAIITSDHKDEEAASLHRISSTVKGCGAVSAHKIMRHEHDVIGANENYWNGIPVVQTERVVHDAIMDRKKIFFEMAQGFDLSLNHGTRFPYTTSRDITVSQAMNDACTPPVKCGKVYGCLRAFPIRVGNAYEQTKGTGENGWSGPYYPDQEEMSWDDINAISGSPVPILERTTVTNKVRRIFTFSHMQLDRFIAANAPTFLFINFVNYLDHRAYGFSAFTPRDRSDFFTRFPKIRRFVEEVSDHCVPIAYLGTGPHHSHIIDMGSDII